MNCPTCRGAELRIAHRHEIEIDYCPSCRGIWLDRGELDKIIQRATAEMNAAPEYDDRDDDWDDEDRGGFREPREDRDERGRGGKRKKKRRMSEWLEDLFDFG